MEKFKPKRSFELEKENVTLYNKIFKLQKEIEDLKFQLYSSDLIISEFECKIDQLKAENRELISKIGNITSKFCTEINNRPPLASNVRGAGRKSRVAENILNLMKSLKNQGLSYSQIAKNLKNKKSME